MTLTGLRYFVALAELRNFSRVAEQYYVAQAAVTYQIKNMEKELGVKLFERSTRSVKLTPAGHNFYMDVAPLLKQLDAACKKAKMRGVKKTFTIGYSRICFGNASMNIFPGAKQSKKRRRPWNWWASPRFGAKNTRISSPAA